MYTYSSTTGDAVYLKESHPADTLIDKNKIESKEEVLANKNPQVIDLVPVLEGAGPSVWIPIIVGVISTAASILLAPKPPDPPEISQTTNAAKTSFTFSNVVNRAAQGTPVPVGYGELIVGSEVIQSTIKSFPIGQETTASFKRNPFNEEELSTESTTQFLV